VQITLERQIWNYYVRCYDDLHDLVYGDRWLYATAQTSHVFVVLRPGGFKNAGAVGR